MDFHPQFIGLKATLRNLRKTVTDKVVSVARIGLPFSVQSIIDIKPNIGYMHDLSRLV